MAQRGGAVLHLLSHEEQHIRREETIDLSNLTAQTGDIVEFDETRQGHLWVLTTHCLIHHDMRSHESCLVSDTLTFSSMAMATDCTRTFCTSGQSLYQCSHEGQVIKTEKISHIPLLSDKEEIRLMTSSPDGSLWMVSNLGRILSADASHKHFRQEPLTEELSEESVQAIQIHRGQLWVMSDKQLLSYHLKDGSIHHYPAGSGDVCVDRFRMHSLAFDGAKTFAGGYGGYIVVGPSKPNARQDNPTIYATDVIVDGKSALFQTDSHTNTFQSVTLDPDIQNIEIHLSSLTYHHQDKLVIQYKLEGADRDWITADASNPMTHHTHLSCGSHTLQCRTRSNDGEWSEAMPVLTLTRLPHWYETWYAYLAYSVLLVLLIAVITLHIRRKQTRQVHTEVTQAKASLLTTEHPFTDDLTNLILTHIEESGFGVDELATAAGTSKSTLHRRMKAEVDMTPLELISSVRMKRACELLTDSSLNISDVAYRVGFSSPKYFTQCFKAEYGETPSDYRKSRLKSTSSPTEQPQSE